MPATLSILLAMFNTYSIVGVLHLVLFVWALIQILGSTMSAGNKILWILLVFLLPVLGLIIYYLFGRSA